MKSITCLYFLLLLLILSSLPGTLVAQDEDDRRKGLPEYYPEPPQTDKLLFFIQRNLNANTIIYDLKRNEEDKIEAKRALDAYYIRYAWEGDRKDLKWIERKFAYGYKSKKHSSGNGFEVKLVAYNKRLVHVRQFKGKYKAFFEINGKEAILKNIYIYASGSKVWPTVEFVEMFGEDPITGQAVYERMDI